MKTRLERGKDMKNKKGFTLIELLAVIVILAIIALIAVPVVMNIISRANKSAFKDSAYGVLKAGENYYMGELLKAEVMTEDKVFDFSKDTSELEINGSKPTDGKMIVNTNGKIAMAIHNGKHCVTKGFEEDDVTITDDVENCEIPIPVLTLSDLATTHSFTSVDGTTTSEVSEVDECATNGICEAGTPFAIKVNNTETYKFYVLSDTGNEVTLIMDRNLGEPVEWISEEDYAEANADDNTECSFDVCGDEGPLTALVVLKERTKTWTNIPKFTYTLKNDVVATDENNYTYPDITGDLVTEVRARLLMETEVANLTSLNGGRTPVYLYENDGAYWLSSLDHNGSQFVYVMQPTAGGTDYLISADYPTLGNSYGLRPVITLSK